MNLKQCITAGIFIVLTGVAAWGAEKEMPKMPEPQKENQWLMQFVGEWNTSVEVYGQPGQPPEKMTGTESARAIDGFWILTEDKGSYMDKPFTGIGILGYNASKKRFVGSWVDSMSDHLWIYEGMLDSSGKILTMEAEGPNPTAPGEMVKIRDTWEVKDKDHRVLTSSMQGKDGAWVKTMTIDYQRQM